MKRIIYLILLLVLPAICFSQGNLTVKNIKVKEKSKLIGNVTVGSSSFDASAVLTITSTTQGMLAPRMNTTARDLIGSPATGLLIYNTQTAQYEFFDVTWQAVGSVDGDGIYDGDGSLSGATTVTMATNNLQFNSTGVTGLFTIDAVNDNIGIGTASPGFPLDIQNESTFGTLGAGFIANYTVSTSANGYLKVLSASGGSTMFPSLFSVSEQAGRGFRIFSAFDTGKDVLTVNGAAFEFRGQGDATLSTLVSNANIFAFSNASRVHLLMDVDGRIIHNVTSSSSLGQPKEGFDFVGTPDVGNNDFLIRRSDVAVDGNLLASPKLIIRATYDDDPTAGVNSADFNAQLQTIVTVGGASAEGRLAFSIEGVEAMNINETQKTTLIGKDATSANFVFLAEDNVGTDLFTIRNDGKVGVNITSPTQQLHVIASGGIAQGTGIRFGNAASTKFMEFGADGGSFSTPTLRSNQTGVDGEGAFYINEIAVADDLLGASAFESAIMFIPRRIGAGLLQNARLFTIGNATNPRFMIMPDGSMLFSAQGTATSGFAGNTTPDVTMDFRLKESAVVGIRNPQDVGDNLTANSPILRQTGRYDADPGAGITQTDFKSELRVFVTGAGASPEGRLAFSVEGTEAMSIDEIGDVKIVNALSTAEKPLSLGVAASTFVVTRNVLTVTGDSGGNTIATITGANSGQILIMIFTDVNVTITDDNSHASDSIDLSAAFTSSDDATLTIIYNGVSWYETSRSIN